MKARRALATAALAWAACALAAEQERGIYLGGTLGQASFNEWCDPNAVLLACDDDTTAWKLIGGYRFNPHVGIEATYIAWGEVTGTVLIAGTPRNASAEQTSIGLAVVGSLPLGPGFSVFAKFGILRNEQETPASSTRNREETGGHYGFGARFSFAPKWAARFEWERTEKLEVEMVSIGAEFRF